MEKQAKGFFIYISKNINRNNYTSIDKCLPVITEDKKVKVDFSIFYKEGEEGYNSAIAYLK